MASSTAIAWTVATVFLAAVLARFEARLSAADATAAAFLNPHNALRRRHGLPLLRWSSGLAAVARAYAEQRRGDCSLVHSAGDYGENLFWGEGSGWEPSDAVAAWAAEEASYDYRTNTCRAGADCTHYTQMVWKTTQRVGCAEIICRSGDTFIVCNYDPHGNVVGRRPY